MRIVSIADLAALAKGRRLDLKLSQADVARRAGVSRKWVNEFEAGKPTAELGHALRVLDALGLQLQADARPVDVEPGSITLDAVISDLRDG